MNPSYRDDLYAAQQFLAFDCSETAAIQREQIQVALRELYEGRLTALTEAAVAMARAVLKGGAL
jgi:site-specific recombinase XerD